MKELPILFSGPMVRAILEGRKTQTRRVLKYHGEQPMTVTPSGVVPYTGNGHQLQRALQGAGCKCPYGQPGDRLWVRETFGTTGETDPFVYRATCDYETRTAGNWYDRGFKWTPSIFMPRKASRITLEITAVRVERLKDISEADAKAEGCTGNCPVGYIPAYAAAPLSYEYAQLWESINGPGSWAANPWVWAVEFKRVTP